MSLNYVRVYINKPKRVQIVHQQMNMMSVFGIAVVIMIHNSSISLDA